MSFDGLRKTTKILAVVTGYSLKQRRILRMIISQPHFSFTARKV